MENVTITNEQFEKLLSVQRGPSVAEYKPEESQLCTSLALELLQAVNRQWFPRPKNEEYPKYNALVDQIRAIAKEYI